MKSNDAHDCVGAFTAEALGAAVHFAAGVGSVIELAQAPTASAVRTYVA